MDNEIDIKELTIVNNTDVDCGILYENNDLKFINKKNTSSVPIPPAKEGSSMVRLFINIHSSAWHIYYINFNGHGYILSVNSKAGVDHHEHFCSNNVCIDWATSMVGDKPVQTFTLTPEKRKQ